MTHFPLSYVSADKRDIAHIFNIIIYISTIKPAQDETGCLRRSLIHTSQGKQCNEL